MVLEIHQAKHLKFEAQGGSLRLWQQVTHASDSKPYNDSDSDLFEGPDQKIGIPCSSWLWSLHNSKVLETNVAESK